MNPTPEEPKVTPTGSHLSDFNATVSAESTPEADQAALQAISALEAEDNPSYENDELPPITVPASTPTPTVPPLAAPIPSTLDTNIATALAETPTDTAAFTNTNPFPKTKKSSKKRILVLILVLALIGAGVAGYFAWQSMQPITTASTKATGGNQPGGTVAPAITDTAASVNDTATSLESDANSTDDSGYDDGTLSDSTLYQN